MAATTAAAELAIAKASLAAVLLRPDPVSCSRTEIDEYARQLATTAARCSPANVQTCKRWMLQHVTSSPARTAAVGRFLVALANSFSPTASPPGVENGEAEKRSIKQTSGRRKRLHLLYIVNDVLYHVTFRDNGINGSARPAFASSIEPFIEPLVASAASFARAPKQVSKIRRLLDLWAEKHYLSENVLARLRAAVDQGPRLAEENLGKKNISSIQSTSVPASVGTSKEAPFHLPALHGDPSTPWYDLPAANWLAILEPNSTRPMNPATLKPLSMTPGPAPPSLVASVQALLADVSRMFDEEFESHAGGLKDTEIELDVNALGERIQVDVPSGDVVGGDTYYGWSRAFCKSMKEGQKRQPVASGTDLDLPDAVGDGGRARRGRSRSSSSSSRPAFKKRHFSASPSPARRDSRRSWSSSRSRSRSSSFSRGYRRGRSSDRHEGRSQRHESDHGRRYRGDSLPRSSSRRSPHSSRHSRSLRSRSRSRSRSESRSPQRYQSRADHSDRDHNHNNNRDLDRERYSHSPQKDSYDNQHHRHHPSHFQQQQTLNRPRPLHQLDAHSGAPPPPLPPPYLPPGAGGFAFVPPPPVPPPGYLGPWPPPLPQMPHQTPNVAWAGALPPPQIAAGILSSNWAGGWAAPQPPILRQQDQQHHPQQPAPDPYRQHLPYGHHLPNSNNGAEAWDRSRG